MKFTKVPGLVTVFIPNKRFKTTTALRRARDRAETLGWAKASPGDRVQIEFVGGAA